MYPYSEYTNSFRNYMTSVIRVTLSYLNCCIVAPWANSMADSVARRFQSPVKTLPVPSNPACRSNPFFPLVQHRGTYITVPGTVLSWTGNVTKVSLAPYRNGIILIRHRKRVSTIAIFSPRYSVALTRVTHVGMRYIAQNMIIEGSPTRMTHQRK